MAKDRSEHDWEEQHSGGGSVTGGSSTGHHVVPGYDPAAHGFAKLDEPEIYTPPQDKHEASCWYSPWLEKDEVAWSDAERAVYSCLVGAIEKIGATEKLKQHLGTDLGLRLSYHGPVSIEEPIDPEPQTVLEEELEELLVKEHKDYAICHVQLSNAPASGYVLRLRITALPRLLRDLTRERKASDDRRVERIEKDRQQRDEQLGDLTLPQAIPLELDSAKEIEEGITRLSDYVDELYKPVVPALQSLLDRLHEIKNLGSYEANAHAASEIYRLAKACGMDLIYEGRPVALGCIERKGYKTGVFRLRTFTGKPETVYGRVDFPALTLAKSN